MATKTMFGKAKYDYLRNIITISNPSAAEGAIKTLMREFRSAATRDKKLRIARATQLAANRAEAIQKRKGISGREITEMKSVARIYNDAAKKMFRLYK